MLYQRLVAVLLGALATAPSTLASPLANSQWTGAKRAIPSTHVLHERQLPHWSSTWVRKHPVEKSAVLPMRIGLRQVKQKEGHKLLMDRSNPRSANFGKHMSAREVIDFFAPSRESVEAVRDWLVAGGINATKISQSVNKQWIQFDAAVAEVEALLHTDYYWFHHGPSGSKNVAAEEYHIPHEAARHIDYITPGIRLRPDPRRIQRLRKRQAEAGKPRKRAHKAMHSIINVAGGLPPLNDTVCDRYVTHECIRNQYSIPKGDKAAPGNELGVFESLGDHYSMEDLDVFYTTLLPEIPNGTYPVEKLIDGAFGAAKSVAQAGIESDLDFEAAIPLIYPQKAILFQTDDEIYELNMTALNTPLKGFWNTFYDALDGSYCSYSAFNETGNCARQECLDPPYPNPDPAGYQGQLQCGVYEPTNVISISYGGGEYDLPASYIKRRCNEIMKLGLQGVTVVISSGDAGVGSFRGDPSPSGCGGPDQTLFYPSNDATCPYTLAVGSTQFVKTSGNSSTPEYGEAATDQFPSGGGFSNYFEAPDYQVDQVAKYFDSVDLNFTGYEGAGTNFSSVGDGVYNAGGRGYPDVSAIGDYFVIRAGGKFGRVGGTSLSAPVWASIITLINEQRIAAGKKTVGFINPVLYAHPEVFTDITNGSNPNCQTTGFLAAPGWDPVTGLGTPKYAELLELLMGLPSGNDSYVYLGARSSGNHRVQGIRR